MIRAYRLYTRPDGNCQFRNLVRIRPHTQKLNATARELFAHGPKLTPVELDLLGAADEYLVYATASRQAHRSLGAE
jgi:hypothetical protein